MHTLPSLARTKRMASLRVIAEMLCTLFSQCRQKRTSSLPAIESHSTVQGELTVSSRPSARVGIGVLLIFKGVRVEKRGDALFLRGAPSASDGARGGVVGLSCSLGCRPLAAMLSPRRKKFQPP